MSVGEQTQAGRAPAEDLADALRVLSDRIETLQADVRRLGAPGLPTVEPGWADDPDAAPAATFAWVSALEAPVRRRPAVPRMLLEGLFLAAVAAGAGLADLEAPVIAAVMAGAWVLVALIEWAASRADRRRDEVRFVAMPAPPEPTPADAAWFVPPVEQTMLEGGAPDSDTLVATLPPPTDADVTSERRRS